MCIRDRFLTGPTSVALSCVSSRHNFAPKWTFRAKRKEKHLLCSHRHTTVIAGPTCLIAHLLAPHDRAFSQHRLARIMSDYVWRPSSLFAAAAVLLSSCLFHPWQQCCVSLPGLFRLPHALLPRPLESLELGFTGVVHVVALGVPTLNVLHLGWLPGPSLASLAHVCDRSDFFSCVCTVYWSVCLSAADCPASFPSELVYYWTSSPPRTVGKNCLLYTSPSPRDLSTSRMPSSA